MIRLIYSLGRLSDVGTFQMWKRLLGNLLNITGLVTCAPLTADSGQHQLGATKVAFSNGQRIEYWLFLAFNCSRQRVDKAMSIS